MTSTQNNPQTTTPSSPNKPPRRPPPSVAPKPKVQFAERPRYIPVKEIHVDTFYVPERDYPRPAQPPPVAPSAPPNTVPLATVNEGMDELKFVRFDQNQNYYIDNTDTMNGNSEVAQNVLLNTQVNDEEEVPPPPTFPPPLPPPPPLPSSTEHMSSNEVQALNESNQIPPETYQSQQTVVNIIRNKNRLSTGSNDTPRFTSSGRYLERQSSISSVSSSMVAQTGTEQVRMNDSATTTTMRNPTTGNGQLIRYVYREQVPPTVPVQETGLNQPMQHNQSNETPLLKIVNTQMPTQIVQSRESFSAPGDLYLDMSSITNPSAREEYQDMQQVRVLTTNPSEVPPIVSVEQQRDTPIVTTTALPRQIPVTQPQPVTQDRMTHQAHRQSNPSRNAPPLPLNSAHENTTPIPVIVSQRQPLSSIIVNEQAPTILPQKQARRYYVPVSNNVKNMNQEFIPLVKRETTPVYLPNFDDPQQVVEEIRPVPNRSIYYINRLDDHQSQQRPRNVNNNSFGRSTHRRYYPISTDDIVFERPVREPKLVERHTPVLQENHTEPMLLWNARKDHFDIPRRSPPTRPYYPQYVIDNDVQHPNNIGHAFDAVDDLGWDNWIMRQDWPMELDRKGYFGGSNWHTGANIQPIPSIVLPYSSPAQYSPPSPFVKTESPFPFVQNGSNVKEIEIMDSSSEDGSSGGSIAAVVLMFFLLALVIIAAATALVITYINGELRVFITLDTRTCFMFH